MSFEIKAEGVDVERLLAEIQRRVEERRGSRSRSGSGCASSWAWVSDFATATTTASHQ